MKTPHTVPLSSQAVEVLRALKLLTANGKLVFPGALDKERPMSNNTLHAPVCVLPARVSAY